MFKEDKIDTKWYVFLALVSALVLRLFNINYEGLWNDELFTAYSARPQNSVVDVVNILKRDIHPPLHTILCNLWGKLFSYSDTSLRVLNILIGTWGVYAIYQLGKLMFNKKVAFYAIGFAVLNYFLIRYSQEVRSYSLMFLMANYSFYYFIKLVRDTYQLKHSIWYILATTAMLYTHFFGVFVVAAQLIAFFFVMDLERFKRLAYKYVITFALPGLLFSFWIPALLKNLKKPSNPWRDAAEWQLIFKYPQDFFNDYIFGFITSIIVLVTLIYLVLRKVYKNKKAEYFLKGHHFALTILLTWIVIYFSIPFVKSLFSRSMLVNRYFMPLVTPIILLLAFYLSKINVSKTRNAIYLVALGYGILILFLNQNPYFTRTTTFREIAQEARAIDSDAPILYLSNNPNYFDYYIRKNHFKKTRRKPELFSKMILQDSADSYFLFLDLRPIPKKYQNDLPEVGGYEMTFSKILKNKVGIKSTQLIQYSRIKDSL